MQKHNFIIRTASVLIFLAAVSVTSLHGQNYGRMPRISVWLTGSLVKPQQQGLYSSAYSPPLQAGEYTSSASQTLSLKPRDALGTSVGISVGISRILNIVFQIDWAVTDLTGINTPYELSLNYPCRLRLIPLYRSHTSAHGIGRIWRARSNISHSA